MMKNDDVFSFYLKQLMVEFSRLSCVSCFIFELVLGTCLNEI